MRRWLVALLALVAAAPAAATPEPVAKVTVERQGTRWTADYQLLERAPVWVFAKSVLPRESKTSWRLGTVRVLTPGVRLQRLGNFDALVSAKGALPKHVRLSFTPYLEDIEGGYDPALARSYSVTTRLLRLARSMERRIARSAASEGLTSGDVLLLDALYRVGPPHRVAPTALKHYFLMSLAGVAKRVDRLAALGFIERVPNPDDRRGLYIQLTTAGHAALARLVEADRTAPYIMWPMALSDAQYRAMSDSLTTAEAMIAAADNKNERS